MGSSGIHLFAFGLPLPVLVVIGAWWLQRERGGQDTWTEVPTRVEDLGDASFPFAVVSDLDHDSRDKRAFAWYAHLKLGTLKHDKTGHWEIEWNGSKKLKSSIALKNRSMELSELVHFGGRLWTVCDSTGLLFEVDVEKGAIYQRVALTEGNGRSTKPFKAEWATVKDGKLLVGSMGREWVAMDGTTVEHTNPQFIKSIDVNGGVTSLDWRQKYQVLREKTNTKLPGYLWHEAVEWDPYFRKWLVLPRKASVGEAYTPESDERRGTNYLFVAHENFEAVEVHRLGELEPEWGFTSIRRVPGLLGTYLVLKAYEVDGATDTRIGLFKFSPGSTSPTWLLAPTPLLVNSAGSDAAAAAAAADGSTSGGMARDTKKYEGLEFLHPR